MEEFTTEIDPITLEVVQLFFVNVVREMRATLIRTSYSPILYETHDFSCGLVDSKGQLIGISHDNPRHIFPVVFQSDVTLKKFKGDINPGDIFIMNDPYTGGTHLNDIATLYPFFFDGELSAIIVVRAHFTDVGGTTPGSISGKVTEIHQEGVRIPPVKICRGGELDKALMEVIFSNMRLSRDREGDFLSMLDTCRTADERLRELWKKYGTKVVASCINTLLERSEKHMNHIISQIPDGVWYYEHYLESSGTSLEPLPLRGKMEVKGSNITFDFSGTASQVRGPVNAGEAMGPVAVLIAVKSLLDPLSPINSGCFRPIKVINPEGTILNARYPAPCGGFGEVVRNACFLVIGLICQAIQEVAVGAAKGGANHTMIGAWDPLKKKEFIFYEYPMGGWGGSLGTDGSHCVPSFDSADMPSFHSTEPLESEQGMRVLSLEMRMGSEGAGCNRGGLGMIRRVQNLGERALLSIVGENAIIPPYGVSGGYPGARMVWNVIRNSERIEFDTPGKVAGFPLQYGDVLEMMSVGGGGYGDPLDRDIALVKQDVLNGYVSKERAKEVYGVVMTDTEVDVAETKMLRKGLRKKRVYLKVRADERDEYDKTGCRLCILSRKLANESGLENGDLIEYVPKVGAPLRAWVKVTNDLSRNISPLGPIGRAILKVQEGEKVEIRALSSMRHQLCQ